MKEETCVARIGGWPVPTAKELEVVLPGYEVLELVGSGGMAAVYKARQESLDRVVAIKVFPVERDGTGSEAETMAGLQHPNIVAMYDSGRTADGRLGTIVMEYMEGGDLKGLLAKEGRLPAKRVLEIGKAICSALAYAHGRGITHRDIKPGNVLIGSGGGVKVVDFGLARGRGDEQVLLTSGGTADYVAPEILKSPGSADGRADVFSLGVLLYEMVTGVVPRGRFKRPSEKVPASRRWDRVIGRAMAADPDLRYQTVEELAEALEGIERGRFRVWLVFVVFGIVGLLGAGVGLMSQEEAPATEVMEPNEKGWVDLLEKVDVAGNALGAPWRRTEGGLVTPEGIAGHEMIELPYENPPENYDLRVELTRKGTGPAIVVGFKSRHGAGYLMVDTVEGSSGNFAVVLGHTGYDISGVLTRQENRFVQPGRQAVVLIKVRGERIEGRVDDRVVVDWNVDWSLISQNEPHFFRPSVTAGRNIFGVGACGDEVVFHRVELREVD